MPIGFRKSIFGFNCDDVLEYIEDSHKEFSEKETVLNERLSSLEAELSAVKAELESAVNEKNVIANQLKEYTDKYDEINRLSQNIGKLYLVAQANAQTVTNAAQENRRESELEVQKNLSALDSAHRALDELKAHLSQAIEGFSKELETLTTSLTATKTDIRQRNTEAAKSTDEADAVLSSIYNNQ